VPRHRIDAEVVLDLPCFRGPLGTGLVTRNGPLPDLPTIAEGGFPGFEIDLWWGVFAPAHTPKEVISHLADVFGSAVETPDIRSKLAGIGFYPAVLCGERSRLICARSIPNMV
jgi:tripartite-type tricarboxylate transporter receptor subunit TctC